MYQNKCHDWKMFIIKNCMLELFWNLSFNFFLKKSVLKQTQKHIFSFSKRLDQMS